MVKDRIQLYDAIAEMDRLTKMGVSFSFSFYKYNRQTKVGGDLARISRARLRAKTSDVRIEHSSYKLFFEDLDSGLSRVCWQVLIVEFNGKECYL